MAPGTYTNAVKSGVQCRTRQSSTPNTQGPLFKKRGKHIQNVEHHEREWNHSKLPLFQRNNDKKNMFLIGISTLKRMLARKMTTNDISTKIKTIHRKKWNVLRIAFYNIYRKANSTPLML